MGIMSRIVAGLCLCVAGFCVFGFLATFEPGVSSALAFRVVYGLLGAACLFGAARLILRRGEAR
jgi:hypothetical protein